MKINLLPGKHIYKANLHTHSTLSDGNLTPEELAKLYYEHGYQVLSITDHEFFMDHSNLNREDFLLLTGYELQIVDESVHPRKQNQRCCHLCLISKDPHDFKQVYFNPDSYDLGRLCHVPEIIPNIKHVGFCPKIKEYSKEVIADVVRTAVTNNMLVAFNHPTWSLENDYDSYLHLDGIYAMEIFNSDCYHLGLEEYNPAVYDIMLREGMRTGCIATDDTHYGHPLGDPRCDIFGGWTMISADDLSYGTIIDALEKRNFYASTGPEIRELFYEDGHVHITTSDAKRISLLTGGRRAECEFAREGGFVNHAVFNVGKDDQYFRITVLDAAGKTANTRGYFLSELM